MTSLRVAGPGSHPRARQKRKPLQSSLESDPTRLAEVVSQGISVSGREEGEGEERRVGIFGCEIGILPVCACSRQNT